MLQSNHSGLHILCSGLYRINNTIRSGWFHRATPYHVSDRVRKATAYNSNLRNSDLHNLLPPIMIYSDPCQLYYPSLARSATLPITLSPPTSSCLGTVSSSASWQAGFVAEVLLSIDYGYMAQLPVPVLVPAGEHVGSNLSACPKQASTQESPRSVMARTLARHATSAATLLTALLVLLSLRTAGAFAFSFDPFNALEAHAAPLTVMAETLEPRAAALISISSDEAVSPQALVRPAPSAALPVDDSNLDRNVSRHTCFVCPDGQPPAGLPPACLPVATATGRLSTVGTIRLRTLLVHNAWPSVCPSTVRLEHVVLADKRGSTEPIWPDKYVVARGRADVSQSAASPDEHVPTANSSGLGDTFSSDKIIEN
ncbi:hypothetical protein HJFPF1_10208 [Paramyrothecium foliicola]|nr:hypothetical protein HJFPF1_10208 [Paramyrothecium foliicola]